MGNNRPVGRHWQRDLVAQMALSVADVRPQVLSPETGSAMSDHLEFRHAVRNVYAFNISDEISVLGGTGDGNSGWGT